VAPLPDPLVWIGPQHINLIQPDPAISFDVGTAYNTGPLSYSQTTTFNGDTVWVYQPGTDAQKMIAYNASTGYWIDWNLENAPSVVYQTQARLVAWKVGTVVYFVFDSPFPITGDSPAQILQEVAPTTNPSATTFTPEPTIIIQGWSDFFYSYDSFDGTLYRYTLRYSWDEAVATGTVDHSIDYNRSTRLWSDGGASSPLTVTQVGNIVTATESGSTLFTFTDPHY
jgi:hypothetical protein